MGIRGWGGIPAEAFEETAAAMLGLMVDSSGLAPSRRLAVSRTGGDLTELLIEFLNALLSEADRAEIVFLGVRVSRLEERDGEWIIEAEARGTPVADVRDRLLIEVKAATYCGASVQEREPGLWAAQCVVDL